MGETTLVASTDGARARLKTGSVLKRAGETVVGVSAVGLAAAAIAWVALAVAMGGGEPARFLAMRAMPVLLTAVGVGNLVAAVGRDRLDEAELLLGGLTVRIDEQGVGWTGPARRALSWEQIRFVVLGRSRLWIGGPEAQRVPRKENPEWMSYSRRVLRLDRFALDAPLCALDHTRAEIERVIREASQGRFPGGVNGGDDGRL